MQQPQRKEYGALVIGQKWHARELQVVPERPLAVPKRLAGKLEPEIEQL